MMTILISFGDLNKVLFITESNIPTLLNLINKASITIEKLEFSGDSHEALENVWNPIYFKNGLYELEYEIYRYHDLSIKSLENINRLGPKSIIFKNTRKGINLAVEIIRILKYLPEDIKLKLVTKYRHLQTTLKFSNWILKVADLISNQTLCLKWRSIYVLFEREAILESICVSNSTNKESVLHINAECDLEFDGISKIKNTEENERIKEFINYRHKPKFKYEIVVPLQNLEYFDFLAFSYNEEANQNEKELIQKVCKNAIKSLWNISTINQIDKISEFNPLLPARCEYKLTTIHKFNKGRSRSPSSSSNVITFS